MKKVLSELYALLEEKKSIKNFIPEVQELKTKLTNKQHITLFVNEVRAIVQQEAALAVINNGGKGIIAMATGSGKSKVGIMLSKHYGLATPERKTQAILVPTEKLRDETWKEEYEKWGASDLYDLTERYCYISASKVEGKKFGLTILDEGHNLTELGSEFFYNNSSDNIVLLSATPPSDPEKNKILDSLGLKIVYHLTLDECVALGFVAPYQITVISIPLNGVTKNIQGGTKAAPFMTTEVATMNYHNKTVQKLMFNKTPAGKKTLQFAIMKRMHFIYKLPSKEAFAKEFLKREMPEEDRSLIFCGSIEQSEALCEHFFHSKSSGESYEKFKNGEINRLATVRAVNEGHNFEGLDSALIVQINSKEKDFIQRLGRILRYRSDHVAQMYILVAEGTQDEKWVLSALENIDKNNVQYVKSLNYTERWKSIQK